MENKQLDNLEIITQRENANKKHIKSSSKYVGVCFNKKRNKWGWKALKIDKVYKIDRMEDTEEYS